MASKIYFKSKHHDRLCFSNEIFNQPYMRVNMLEPIKELKSPNDKLTIREYFNINQVIEDDEMFMILTESSFTENELMVLREALYTFATVDTSGKSFLLREKIDSMIFSGNYLPDDESKIINK